MDDAVAACAADGAAVVMLPEACTYLGRADGRLAVAEGLDADGPMLAACRRMARDAGVHLLVGGFPEAADATRTFNTALHLDDGGRLRAAYRKIHRFDVDLDDGTRLRESDSTAAGDAVVVTDAPCGRTALTICYDLRFPELYRRCVDAGATVLTAPSAFTARTGPDHWETLLRARALESQCWMLAAAQTGDHGGGRRSHGHALAVDPWGTVVLDLGTEPGHGLVRVDPARTAEVRARLPSLAHRQDPARWREGPPCRSD
jgi:predicted amidohydrolase